jgi:hypothetical protein
MKSFLFILIILSLFSGCSGISTGSEKQEIPEEKCGNGIVDEGEMCDFKDTIPCSGFSPDLVGPLRCDSCRINSSSCQNEKMCSETKCNSRGRCVEGKTQNMVYCNCYNGYSGYDCSFCSRNYHLDFNGLCISDEKCTLKGCPNFSTCRIYAGKSECVCEEPYMGENCDRCMYGYKLVNKICTGYYCNKSGLKCPEFEKCDDTDGVPRCICKGPNQNPYNCSECVQGFDWYFGQCLNKVEVSCTPNPDKPENSVDIEELTTIKYVEGKGWSEPSACKWECIQDTFLFEGKCLEIELFYSTEPHFQFGFDDNGSFIAGNSSGTVFIINDSIRQRIETGIPFTNGRLGAEGNIYFRTEKGFGVLNYETGSYFYFNYPGIPENQLTMTMDGTVFYGDSYFSFPDLIPVLPEHQNFKAVTISDSDGSTLTVYEEGYLAYMNYKQELIWSKKINDHKFSSFPVVSSHKSALLPCVKTDVNMTYTFEIYLPGETYFDSLQFYADTATVRSPGVSIEKDNRRFTAARGVLKVYEVNNKLMYYTSSVFAPEPDTRNIPPVIAEDGFVYFVSGHSVVGYRNSDKMKWTFNVNGDGRPETLIHKDDRLFVFSSSGGLHILKAPGNSAGPWPQALHDFNLTGSLFEIEYIDPPLAPVALTPEDNAVFNTNSVTFSWEIDSLDPNIKYTLLLRDSSGYDKVYAGPEIGLTNTTVNDLAAGTYEWRIVSKDENGSLNVSEKRTFTVN